MRIVRDDATGLELRDPRSGRWFVAGFLVALGTLVLAGTFGLAIRSDIHDPVVRALAAAAGFASWGLAGMVFTRFPLSAVSIDSRRRTLVIQRGWPTSLRFHARFDEVLAVQLDGDRDSDGDDAFRVVVVTLAWREPLSLHRLHDRAAALALTERIRLLTGAGPSPD